MQNVNYALLYTHIKIICTTHAKRARVKERTHARDKCCTKTAIL